MKILMFGWEFPPHIAGGLAIACYGLTKGLGKLGVDMIFVVPKSFGDEDQTSLKIIGAEDYDIRYEDLIYENWWKHLLYIQANSNLIPYLSPEQYQYLTETSGVEKTHFGEYNRKFKFSGGYGHNLMTEVANYALLAVSIAQQHNFDVIHAHDWLTYMAGIAAKRVSGKPLVIHVHATEFDRSGENINQRVYDIERRGMEEADLIMAVSHLTRNIIIQRYGISPEKVITVHNAVDFCADHCHTQEKGTPEKIVTFLGRITYQKGPEYFIEVAKKVLKYTDNVRFVMAGSGDLMNKMVHLVAKYKIAHKFNFTGFLRGNDVAKMLAMSDVYVMPSVSEPFGISPLEAMRAHVPTIISRQSGVAEILKHAIKVNFWDVDAMADAIHGIIKYPALNKMFIEHGDREVNTLKWDNVAVKVRGAYESLLQQC